MPLVWAHAEYLKLRRSLNDGRVFDTPPQTVQRYQMGKTGSPHALWRFNQKCRTIAAGKLLRLEVLAQATIRWSVDGWRTAQDTPTVDTGFGVYYADLLTTHLAVGDTVTFTLLWVESEKWEGTNYSVTISRR